MSISGSAAVALSPLPATPHLTVSTITDYRSFLALERVWNQVHEEAATKSPFLTHEWMRSWWDAFGKGRELHILLLKSGPDPVAIAPLMFNTGRMLGVRVRRLESIHNLHTPRFDFLVAHYPGEVYQTLWGHLLSLKSRWDVLQLNQLPEDSPTLEEIPRLAGREGYLTGIWHSADSPFVSLDGNWESYCARLDSKHRSNLRNREKRLKRLGAFGHDSVVCGPELDESLEDGFRIEAAAWKGKAGTAIACQPTLRRFYTVLADRFAGRGWLRLHFLRAGGRRIAFAYSI